MAGERFGICEWYGKPFVDLPSADRKSLAAIALSSIAERQQPSEDGERVPPCPYQPGRPPCRKRGGVCSLQRYKRSPDGLLGESEGSPVIVCPARFEQEQVPIRWLAEIVGFAPDEAMFAREVAFMRGTRTDKPAGKIDLVVARTSKGSLDWFGLETQAVYFSGSGMQSEFESLRGKTGPRPRFPDSIRRPDWRSSSAKRLMPQLQIKVPTLRRWGSKMAVVVDRPFFDSLGGASPNPSQDLGDGDIIWMVVDLSLDAAGNHRLTPGHWEVLTLEASCEKLLAAETVQQEVFLDALRSKLGPIPTQTGPA